MLEDCELLIIIPTPQYILIKLETVTFLLIINKFVYSSNIKFVLCGKFSLKVVIDIAWRGCNLLADVSRIEWMKQNFLAQNFHPLEQRLHHIELGIMGHPGEERNQFLDHHYHHCCSYGCVPSNVWAQFSDVVSLGSRKQDPSADDPTVTTIVFVQVWHWERI